MTKPEAAPAGDMTTALVGQSPTASSLDARSPATSSLSVAVAMVSKAEQSRVEYCGGKGELLGLGEIYLNDLSDIYMFEITNLKTYHLKLQLRAELRKPFQTSQWCFQLENENVSIMQRKLQQEKDRAISPDEFNHVPFSILRLSSKATLCAKNVYLCEGYNELFNHIETVDEIVLGPQETKKVMFTLCTKLTLQHSGTGGSVYMAAGDSSEEERAHLSETSCFVLSGRLILQPSFVKSNVSSKAPMSEMVVPLQAQVCRSLLRLDVKELHFDDCVPGGSFVKDFTVWNRSEIPLLFNLVSPLTPWSENNEVLVCTDYNSGYVIGDKTLQAAAYGHVRIRVTYRPMDIGERFFEIQAQNVHDSRNVKILRIHAVTNQEHHREGLSIKEPDGSYLMSGSRLDFGDCYTGIASSKVILMRNMTEVALHVELSSERPKEVTYELKLQQNRSRVPRSPRPDELLSPYSNDESSIKGPLSPNKAETSIPFSSEDAYGLDSDEEVDDNDDNEGEFYEEELQQTKRNSFEENPMGDGEDLDDDFEFDRESRAPSESPSISPKVRVSRANTDLRTKSYRSKGKKPCKVSSKVRNFVCDSGVDSPRSSPERNFQADSRKRHSVLTDDSSVSNFLVETIDLPPGVERTIFVWYTPASSSNLEGFYRGNLDAVDLKAARLTKQNFRMSFRCFALQGAWQQSQSREYDRTLGKSIHIRARTCTSMVTVTPSILHLGDCNIGELKSSSCMLTNHSELPTVVKPLVTSKVISTVPNDDMMLGPKQSTELKIEIIPRKTNPNYSRLISVINMRNKSNISQICVRSSNMDAHHVIYHSLFYKLLTQSRSAFLNFEHVTINSVGLQVFDLENITNAPLHLNIQSSAPSKVRLYCIKHPFGEVTNLLKRKSNNGSHAKGSKPRQSLSSVSSTSQSSVGGGGSSNVSTQKGQPPLERSVRRRRSFCSVSELKDGKTSLKRGKSTALRELFSKKRSAAQTGVLSNSSVPGAISMPRSVSTHHFNGGTGRQDLQKSDASEYREISLQMSKDGERSPNGSSFGSAMGHISYADKSPSEEVESLLQLFAKSRFDCDAYCHNSIISKEKEEEIVAMVRERTKRLETLYAKKTLISLNCNKERNLRIPAKSRQRIVAVFRPVATETELPTDISKTRVEKHKIMITLPPGGNKKITATGENFDQSKAVWASPKHPFDTRPSVRELLLKSRVCRSIMNVNQKNINFGRIATSSKSSKRLVVQNMSATCLVYSLEKTGSISSGFLQIKEGEVGVVKAFGTKEICFQFQPILAGPFEEKLKIINVQDPENSVSVTIKAKVVKRETFKLLQSGQTISFGKCLVGEKTDEVKIAVRNTSRKKREYVIQLDPTFNYPTLRPAFYFSIDETPAAVITQAQENKLDEELEKLEHKLRIALTKKKADKIVKLNAKISQVKALLSGEQLIKQPKVPLKGDPDASRKFLGSSAVGDNDPYESGNSDSEMSESEFSSHLRRRRSRQFDKSVIDAKNAQASASTNTLHFSLGAEATGRIVAYAIFNPFRPDDISPHRESDKCGAFRSQRTKKRLLRRDANPISGTGKFLLFEQQNKDVVKELHYSAEIFLRTLGGENAFCRAVGRSPPSVLPPHPHTGVVPPIASDGLTEIVRKKAHDVSGFSRYEDVLPSLIAPYGTDSEKVDRRSSLSITTPNTRKATRILNMDFAPYQPGISPTSSSLLVPAEESPTDTRGWTLTLSLEPASYRQPGIVEMSWNPANTFKNVIALTCEVVPRNYMVSDDAGPDSTDLKALLPLKLNIPPDCTANLKLNWCYTSEAGFAPTTPLASCVSRSVLESVSEAAEINAGRIEFSYHPNHSPPQDDSNAMLPFHVSSANLAVVKGFQRSLFFEQETIDLGEHQQGENVRSEIVIFNRSHQAHQFLLLAESRDHSIASSGNPLLVGGEMTFENATGTVEAGSSIKTAFVYKGNVPGQHTEQIVLRNLSGSRLDTSILEVLVCITRPVYVRVPELDPQSTGHLNVLDLGPCYVTPDMQDTAVDSPNVSLKFSKVHKLTLKSQVDHTLVICASSNLKTQCFVYEDARLHREATHVVVKGNESIDLYVAIRPRLSSDALKTGSTRDLVGGIRVQLFGLQRASDTSEDEKSEMLTEFTVKFVGVAGASVARVTPSLIDFGVEHNIGQKQMGQEHEGCFELINMSKALPLRYRLSVTSATEDYSDDENSLYISLKHEKGEIPPGETGNIEFRVMAVKNGLFRRRIMVESIHYPGRKSFVDIVLFVDNGTLRCKIPAVLSTNNSCEMSLSAATQKPPTLHTMNIGHINVIQLEDKLMDCFVTLGVDNEPSRRNYRVYGEHGNLAVENEDTRKSIKVQSKATFLITFTNATKRSVVVRPLSTLPLVFKWNGNLDETFTKMGNLLARSTSADFDPVLQPPAQQYFYGDSYLLQAKSSCSLAFRFAAIAATLALPSDLIDSGKLCPFRGIIGIQSVKSAEDIEGEACILKVVNVLGSYCEPRFHIAEKCYFLGKFNYGLGSKASTFQICIKNVSDVAISFIIANLPPCIQVRCARDASRIQFDDEAFDSELEVPSLRRLAFHAGKSIKRSDTPHWDAWRVKPRASCVLEMELVRTNEVLTAGIHEFHLRFFNVCNPHNREDVVVRAQIISKYAELAIDPESSSNGIETATPIDKYVALLPPVTVPAPQESPSNRSSFWFSLRNVYDEELCVKLFSEIYKTFDRTLELLLMLRSANTPLSSILIAPGESVDIRVVCLVLPSARLPADIWSCGNSEATGEILELGRVWLHIHILNVEDAAQREEIHVKGKLLPGKTFVLSVSRLNFFATATDVPSDIPIEQLPLSLKSNVGTSNVSSQSTLTGASQQSEGFVVYQVRNFYESFWVKNPSTVEELNFVINPASMYQPKLCLIKGISESDICAMSEFIQVIAVPSSGTIAPGESVKVTVHLEETSLEAQTPPSSVIPYHESGDIGPAGKVAALHKMRHHPSWRSNSWDADEPKFTSEESEQNHMFLVVRDADLNLESEMPSGIDISLILQQQSSASDFPKQGGVVLDKALIVAAFEARDKRLARSRKLYPGPAIESHVEDELYEQLESSELDNFEKFDISLIRSGPVGPKTQLPVLTIRGCTPAEYSSLENTRYLIDVGQHTVRNGGEVEWEITIESLYSATNAADAAKPDSVEYRLTLVDKNARLWLHLSRERGTLDRAHSFQSVVLRFLRGEVGVFSTFMVLQNLANPSDLKVIHVRLEVIADLNSLRGMSSGLDPATNLFRVLVPNHSSPKRSRRSQVEMPSEKIGGGAPRLLIDFSEVYYYKLYQNHSIVIENSSSLSLDFILSTNARPQEIGFSVSPTSFNEITTITLGSHASMQVFLHFRPQPMQLMFPSGSNDVLSNAQVNEPWVREIEVYVSCRLVKDFRETVIIRAICSQPQLMVNVANGETHNFSLQRENIVLAQPTFLGLVFPMLESSLASPDLATKAADEIHKYFVVRNTKSDVSARLALRNDSLFFGLAIDENLTQPGAATVDLLDYGMCAGRRSTLLVTIQPQSVAVFRVKPDVAALWKHHQLWDHSVKEHVTLYNIKQFAEHYQVTLCFTCSNVASFYTPPNISESYPVSALEDIVAKFLQNHEFTWKWLISYHEKTFISAKHSGDQSLPALNFAEVLNDLESALDLASPLSPQHLKNAAVQSFDETESVQTSQDNLQQLVLSYRALYFDFYYITDELVWYGVRGNAVRHSLALADLAYGIVFNHEIFRTFLSDAKSNSDAVAFPRLLLPWIRQLGYFLSFFPENQEATQPLRQVYGQLRKFETN